MVELCLGLLNWSKESWIVFSAASIAIPAIKKTTINHWLNTGYYAEICGIPLSISNRSFPSGGAVARMQTSPFQIQAFESCIRETITCVISSLVCSSVTKNTDFLVTQDNY